MAEARIGQPKRKSGAANLHFDNRLESYCTFFDHNWAKQMHRIANNTKLEKPVDLLALHWKSVANAHMMPWMLTTSVADALVSYMQADSPYVSRVVAALHQRLTRELGDAVPRRSKKAIQTAMNRIAFEVVNGTALVKKTAARGMSPTSVWSQIIDLPELVLSVCGAQRLCYAGVYFAYENYVRHCTSLATGKDEQQYHDDFKVQFNDMRVEFGTEIADYLADKQVNIARHVRNALVHASGRVSGDLRYVPHGLREDDGVLQIMAPDTIALYNALKERALCLAKHASELPAFKVTGIAEGYSSHGVNPQDGGQVDER